MSQLGQNRKSSMRANVFRFAPKADITLRTRYVRFVPTRDSCIAANNPLFDRKPRQRGFFSNALCIVSCGYVSNPDLFAPDIAGRPICPAMECTPEIRGVAEPKRSSDILVRQICAAKVVQRELSSQFIAQSAEGNALLPKLAP